LAESAPDFRQAQTELAAMRAQMSAAEKADTSSGAGSDSDYTARYRDFKYFETLFELFAKQYEIARLDESREGAVIQVVDTAVTPERKAKPKKALIALMTTLGTGFALLLFVFIRQALRGAAQSPESAEKLARLRQAFGRALGRG
jgi:tyrosine-protein kinase Etk/Wzc